VLLDAFWYGKVREAQALLHSAYSQVAQDHLAAPLPEDESSGRGSSHCSASGFAGPSSTLCAEPLLPPQEIATTKA